MITRLWTKGWITGGVSVLAVMVVAVAATAEPTTHPSDTAAGVGPKLKVESDGDLGTVTAGETVKYAFKLRNVGDAPLEILKVKGTCGCTVIKTYDRTIAPGAVGEIPLVLSTRGMKGPFAKTVKLETNDPSQPKVNLKLTGKVFQWIEMSARGGVNFGRVLTSHAEPVTRTITLTSNADVPMTMELVKVTNERFTAELKMVEQGKTYELTARIIPPFELGAHKASVELKTNLAKMPKYNVRLTLYVQPRVSVMPARLKVPPITRRATKLFAFISSYGPTPVHVLEATATDPKLLVQLSTVKNGAKYKVLITVPIGYELSKSDATIVIKTDDEEYARIEVPIVASTLRAPQAGTRQQYLKVGSKKIPLPGSAKPAE